MLQCAIRSGGLHVFWSSLLTQVAIASRCAGGERLCAPQLASKMRDRCDTSAADPQT